MADIEKQLKDAARRAGYSMKALSEMSGVPYASVHGFMTSNRQISISTAAKLAVALGLELCDTACNRKRKGR